ncbi:MAG: DUF4347 domain-containing protein, partial [Planctomycetota bacterium]
MPQPPRPLYRLEELEPRLLLSADIVGFLAEAALIAEQPVAGDATSIDSRGFPAGSNGETAQDHRQEVAFVDTSIQGFEQLAADIEASDSGASVEIILLDSRLDGLQQITDALVQRSQLDAVHIFSHGSGEGLQLGSRWLSHDTISDAREQLSHWQTALQADADILLYGCDLASTETGRALVETVAALTQTDVAASANLTGSSGPSDWQLEHAIGAIETGTAVNTHAALWSGTLDITSNLLLHTTFDFDVTDSSGNAYDGSLTNGAAINNAAARNRVGAGKLSLDGSNDYVDHSAHVASFDNLTEGTIAAWVYADTAGFQTIFEASDSGDTDNRVVLELGSSGEVRFAVLEGSGELDVETAAGAVATGTWTHLAITVDSAHGHRIYIDGSMVQTGLTYYDGAAGDDPFFDDVNDLDFLGWGIDKYNTSTLGTPFDGFIDDGRVYDRALTSDDIRELYALAPSTTAANTHELWLTTETAVMSSGAPGLSDWSGGEFLQFTDPDLSFSPTDGSFHSLFNLDDFAVDADARVAAIHYVGTSMNVGTNTIALQQGDVLFATVNSETLNNSDLSTTAVEAHEIILFEPDTPGDYSAGTFSLLIDGEDVTGIGSNAFHGITLVESATTIGTTTTIDVDAGDFLLVNNIANDEVRRYQPGTLGTTSTGTVTTILDGSDAGIDLDEPIRGLELIEASTTIGNATLVPGQLLLSLHDDDSDVGGISTTRDDIFVVNITDAGTTTNATAAAFFEGDDVNLNTSTWQEQPWAFSLRPLIPTDIVFDSESSSDAQVNTYVTLGQTTASIAAFDDGGYIVVWASDEQDGSGMGIYGQRYDSAGNTKGAEFLIPSETTDEEIRPSVTTFSDGGFAVAWQDQQSGVRAWTDARVFNADGTAATSDFQLSPGTDGNGEGYQPNVLALDADNFVAVWSNETGGTTYDVEGQIYDRTGSTVGSQFTIGSLGVGAAMFSSKPSSALLEDGGFVTIWRHYDGSTFTTRTRVLNSDGSARSSVITLGGDSRGAIAGLANGNFVVTYGNGTALKAVVYDSTGSVVTSEFDVNTTATALPFEPSVTRSDDGFVIAWRSDNGDGSGAAILAQRFDAAGNKVDGEVVVNQTTAGAQEWPVVTELASGAVRAAWDDPNIDGNSTAIVSREFATGDATVAEDADLGTFVADALGVLDPGSNEVHTFTLTDDASGRFAIGRDNGKITVANPSLLDYETDTSHNVTVRVTDSTGFTYDEALSIAVTAVTEVSGIVYEDVDGDGDVGDDGVGSEGVTVHLYSDGGDGDPDGGDDTYVTSTKTGSTGAYSFGSLANDTYWVVVESRTVAPTAGLNSLYAQGDVWADQTYGTANSVTYNGSYSYSGSAGTVYGGQEGDVVDDASALATAEHVIRSVVSGSDISGVNFGFSFNVITNTNDATNADSFTTLAAWAAFDAGDNAIGTDPDGFSEAIFDGRYTYFIPYSNGSNFHGEVLRYDGYLDPKDVNAWSTFDPGANGVGTDPDGYSGGAFDGRYVYFAPYHNGGDEHGEVMRFDSYGEFTDVAAWDTFDPGANGVGVDPDGYEGVEFDGRYLYFSPWDSGTGSHSEVLRYDTTADFSATGSWHTFDFVTAGVTNREGYDGLEYDGRYIYFVPLSDDGTEHGEIVRYDTTASFSSVSSWDAYDPGSNGVGSDADGYSGATFDGQYLYFVPLDNGASQHGEVLRYDTTGSFSTAGSWSAFDLDAGGLGGDAEGFLDPTFDGRYVYFSPFDDGSGYIGNAVRYDTQGTFNSIASWAEYNPEDQGLGDDPVGYWGAAFDNRYVLYSPITDSGGSRHGEVLIFDTLYRTAGQGSMRQFLENSNAIVGVQSSEFAIPTNDPGYNGTGNGEYTIDVASALPTITDAVILDAQTQDGYGSVPLVELDGTVAGGTANGIYITAGSSTIRGFVIQDFDQNGILIETAGGNTIEGNYIGTNVTGASDSGNSVHGIAIATSGNTIGGTSAATTRNVISGNDANGIQFTNSSATSNNVYGNYIGTNAAGTSDVGNTQDGIYFAAGANNNNVGGTLATQRNVISGNLNDGIEIVGNTTLIAIHNNYIGTDYTGLIGVGNVRHGIVLYNGVHDVTIGGIGTGNVISDQGSSGIVIDGNSDITTADNIIQGNLIGTAFRGILWTC